MSDKDYTPRDRDGNLICAHVGLLYCDGPCVAAGGDRGDRCIGHRDPCTAVPFVVIQQFTPSEVLRTGYFCVNHWEGSLILWNDFPPDPGYEQATASLYDNYPPKEFCP